VEHKTCKAISLVQTCWIKSSSYAKGFRFRLVGLVYVEVVIFVLRVICMSEQIVCAWIQCVTNKHKVGGLMIFNTFARPYHWRMIWAVRVAGILHPSLDPSARHTRVRLPHLNVVLPLIFLQLTSRCLRYPTCDVSRSKLPKKVVRSVFSYVGRY
jgi:hypothetical protein